MHPVEVIQKAGTSELRIRWDDGHESVTRLTVVRLACACATCNDNRRKRTSVGDPWPPPLDTLPPSVRDPQVREIRPVGGYALNFIWGDGHAHGIYTYTHLRELCECEVCRAA